MIIPEGYANVVMHGTVVGSTREWAVTLGIADITLTPRDTVTLTADFKTTLFGTNRPFDAGSMLDDFVFRGVVVTQTVDGEPVVVDSTSTVTGTVTGEPVPINGAVLVKKNTLAGGRKNRGRFFFPPMHVTEANVSAAGVLTAGAVTGVQTIMNLWYGAMIAANIVPTLLHNSITTPTPISSFSVESVLATQRRRMRS